MHDQGYEHELHAGEVRPKPCPQGVLQASGCMIKAMSVTCRSSQAKAMFHGSPACLSGCHDQGHKSTMMPGAVRPKRCVLEVLLGCQDA
eukprot:1158513-Pelagomonas_calceolata.AAC.5